MTVVRRIYTPKAGHGGKLLRMVKELRSATVEAGFPPITILRVALGPHGKLVTTQRWRSIAEYVDSRSKVRQTKSITGLFDQIYPLLATTHETELYEEID